MQKSEFRNMTIIKIFVTIILLFICIPGVGQTKVKLSKPRLELRDNKMYFYYDIPDINQAYKFKVWIEVTDSTKSKIIPRSITLDLGENVTGGNNKKVIWDFSSDSLYLDKGINVQLNSELILPPEIRAESKHVKEIKRRDVIFRSVLFPGWGLYDIDKCKQHLLKGVAGYGCIVASVMYNKKAISSYNKYLASNDSPDINNFFNNSVKEKKLSEAFAYTAIGIWVIDFVWTVAGSSKLKNYPLTGQSGKILIYPDYEPDINASMVSLRLNF